MSGAAAASSHSPVSPPVRHLPLLALPLNIGARHRHAVRLRRGARRDGRGDERTGARGAARRGQADHVRLPRALQRRRPRRRRAAQRAAARRRWAGTVRDRHCRGAGDPRRIAAAASRRRPWHRGQRLVHDRAEACRARGRRAVFHVLSRRGRHPRLGCGVSQGASPGRRVRRGHRLRRVLGRDGHHATDGRPHHPPRRSDAGAAASAERSPPSATLPQPAFRRPPARSPAS